MDLNLMRSAVTVAGLLLFVGVVAWTWWPRRKGALEQAAQQALAGDDLPGTAQP
ncbi:MAG TPA: CcoQ/FixQ family Cbb3-type cytochrome c oxidase assembly chaperone [Rubrivivax sp.]|jgi:cbb3-type cytochrome oxidase subunit 3|nr:CcoQ/FixQ family Cbb3-type cytochrome c oxidase assembly chaperone [Rubrivivax sp.]